MQKPISRYGQADNNGIYRWENGFLWWPDSRLLVTKYLEGLDHPRYSCPLEVIREANMALCVDRNIFFDEDEFFEGDWPKNFRVFKSRYGPTNESYTLTRLDFRLMLIC